MHCFFAHLAKLIRVSLALLVMAFSCSAFSGNEIHLDHTFAGDGVAKITFGPGKSWVTAGAIQPDGKIIAVGSVDYKDSLHAIALARTNPNGVLDDGFGDNGVVITKIGINSQATAVGIMPDGRIVVVGWAFFEKGRRGVTLTMYNADGTLDSRFGDQGLLIFPVEYSAAYTNSLAVQLDGKIVIGGKITIRKEYGDLPFVRSVPDDHIFLARLNDNGSFDESFGERGVVVTDVGGGDVRITGLTIQQDGRLIVAGIRQKNPNSTLILGRYNSNGSLDQRFGVEGLANRTRTIENGRYSSPTVLTTTDGRIYLVAGYSSQANSWLLLSRLRDDGSPDLTFGELGTVTTKMEFWRYSDFIPVLQSDGRILISGMSVRPPTLGQTQPPFSYSVGIARFLPTGGVDNAVGQNGMHVVSIGSVTDKPAYMAVQNSGRIVIVGYSANQVAQQAVLIGLVP